MSRKHSLKYQFRKQLIISIGLLVLVFSFLLYQIFFIGISSSMHRSMMSMVKHYAQQIEADPSFNLPENGEYSLFVGRKSLPIEIEELFDIDSFNRFDFKVSEKGEGNLLFKPKNLTFLVSHPLRNRSGLVYLVYSEKRQNRPPEPSPLAMILSIFGADEKRPPPPFAKGRPPAFSPREGAPDDPPKPPLLNVPNSIFFIIILAILLVYWVSKRLISKVLNPLNELTVMAKSLDENNPELSFDVMKNKTEIGVVAKTLHQTMERMHHFHQREKQFLQNTSHELRTPIAVVSSALDVIELRNKKGNSDISDQHINIRRANKNMAEMTNALLLLSRKDTSFTRLEEVNLKQLSENIIEEHKYLLKGKNVDIELSSIEDKTYQLPTVLCRIVLSNLIRNAFEHTQVGMVKVETSDVTVIISNSSLGLDEGFEQAGNCGEGFGIGLDIVKKVVEQQQWQLTLSSDPQQGSCVIICFEKND